MPNIKETLRILQIQRDSLQGQVSSLDEAIAALAKVAGPGRTRRPVSKKKKLSPQALKNMRLAQRRRREREKEMLKRKEAKVVKKAQSQPSKKEEPLSASE